MLIPVGGRPSPLSKIQIEEIQREINLFHPGICFEKILIATTGDLDQKTSLRTLEKSNFFTKEIDELLLSRGCRISIHSAKDLPSPLPEGLTLVALTKGLNPADSLVFRKGENLNTLASGAVIATSSDRREEAVRQLRKDFVFRDLRGTIGQRLARLESGEADGVVVAEAALIRLNLTHLDRITLPGSTTPYQGQLAVLARQGDFEMENIFACIDSRKKALYLGLKAPSSTLTTRYVHYPVIKIVPRPANSASFKHAIQELPFFTHLIFTSQSTVNCFFHLLAIKKISRDILVSKQFIAVGKATADSLQREGNFSCLTAQDEQAEGILDLLNAMDLTESYIFFPHSSLSRPLILNYLEKRGVRHLDCVFYDTEPAAKTPRPNLEDFDEVIFTSPSTVDAFLHYFGKLPAHKTLTCKGPITSSYLKQARDLII